MLIINNIKSNNYNLKLLLIAIVRAINYKPREVGSLAMYVGLPPLSM
jgi:hypothetical protein